MNFFITYYEQNLSYPFCPPIQATLSPGKAERIDQYRSKRVKKMLYSHPDCVLIVIEKAPGFSPYPALTSNMFLTPKNKTILFL